MPDGLLCKSNKLGKTRQRGVVCGIRGSPLLDIDLKGLHMDPLYLHYRHRYPDGKTRGSELT